PHLLAMPCLVAWVAGLVQARAERRAPSWWLLPVMVLWANLHGGFVVGLGIAGALAVEAVIAARNTWRGAAKAWALFLAGAAAASLATPQGLGGWLFPFHLMSLHFALDFVQEWHQPDYSTFQPVELWLGGFFALLAVTRRRVPPMRALLVAVLIAMALT